ncbi:MAG: sigma-70 family RNA polymerase sigma factor [Cytophagales bacterium]|nr:sigma-70 family RNA polymerase sigma factor [Cytophagales bacterium]
MGFVEFHNVNDSQIWDKFRKGNVSAFEMIYERNINMLSNYGNRMSRDKDMVKDAVQDMFVDLWRNRANLGPTDSIKYYLIKAFRRNLVKKIAAARKFDSQEEVKTEYEGSFDLAHDESLIAAEIERSKRNELNEQLEKISPRQKEALFLRFYGGLDYAEISETMGINQQSAYNMVFRALELLRERMVLSHTSMFLLFSMCLN